MQEQANSTSDDEPLPFGQFLGKFKPIVNPEAKSLGWGMFEVGLDEFRGRTVPDIDEREWWTVIVWYEENVPYTYLLAGFRLTNRICYVRCEVKWDGSKNDQPAYIYNEAYP
jgi:hypothetical protein